MLLVRIGCREVEKWQTWIFEKKVLIWRHLRKGLQISLKIGHFDIFLKNGPNDFFGFWPEVSTKYDFQFEWNLLFRKISYLEIFDLEIIKKIAQIEVFGHFLDFVSLVFLDFAHNDRWKWCLVTLLQFAGPFNVFLFSYKKSNCRMLRCGNRLEVL